MHKEFDCYHNTKLCISFIHSNHFLMNDWRCGCSKLIIFCILLATKDNDCCYCNRRCRSFTHSNHFSMDDYELSKKRNVLSLSTAFIFRKLNMCKYLYEHNKIKQLRHKLNKFHRHVTNRNGIMCPWNKGGSKSKVTVSIWCGHQLH